MRRVLPALIENARRYPLLAPFARQPAPTPPIWLMRQAGRYLPEYRQLREQGGSFFGLCYTPQLAAEVTLQPIRRFGFDAAIIFSDILVVPHALGQRVEFVEGEGPRLEPITSPADFGRLDPSRTADKFGLVYEALGLVRQALPQETALIGFCGAPWTVATYMVSGRGTPDQADARLWAYRAPTDFELLIDLLTTVSIEHLSGQVAAGATAVQIFDSWAGSLPDDEFSRWVIEPTRRIVAELKARYEHLPIIGFPRAAGEKAATYARETGVDGVGCDTGMSLALMGDMADTSDVVVQGNLDPLLLLAGGDLLDARVDQTLSVMAGRPFIFNLGHGILPETPPEHVGRLVERVRGAR